MFVSNAFAQSTQQAGGESLILSLAPLILIFVIFYFLLIRPQQKRAKQHQEMINNVRRGDTIITAGGLVGKVAKVSEGEEIVVDFAENVKLKVVRSMISDVRVKGEPAKTTNKTKNTTTKATTTKDKRQKK